MSSVAESRPWLVRRGLAVTASVLLLAAGGGAARAQNGLFDFFGQTHGGGDADEQPLPQPAYASPEDRPLTVRAHRRHRLHAGGSSGAGSGARQGGRYNVADLKGVTIYTDKTLSRGDAVMTASGIKVFNGSNSWPYTEDDFVGLSATTRMPKVLRTELTAINDASRPALHPH